MEVNPITHVKMFGWRDNLTSEWYLEPPHVIPDDSVKYFEAACNNTLKHVRIESRYGPEIGDVMMSNENGSTYLIEQIEYLI